MDIMFQIIRIIYAMNKLLLIKCLKDLDTTKIWIAVNLRFVYSLNLIEIINNKFLF
jgi:hypothetical protein